MNEREGVEEAISVVEGKTSEFLLQSYILTRSLLGLQLEVLAGAAPRALLSTVIDLHPFALISWHIKTGMPPFDDPTNDSLAPSFNRLIRTTFNSRGRKLKL